MSVEGKDDILSLDDEALGSSASHGSSSLTLLSRDHQSFSLSKEAAAQSDLLRTMMDGDPDASEVQLYHIDSSTVRRLIDYLNYHRTTPPRTIDKPIASVHMTELVDAFDAAFVDVEQEVLFRLLLAANYLHIRSLVALCSAKFASWMKNKTPQQIKQTFGIRLDATPQEEADIAREYRDLIG